jgi:uncharacterized heparinase superfamily protein
VSLWRLYRTVRHLKPVQIYGRALYRLARPTPDLRAAPSLRPTSTAWTQSARRAPSMTGPQQVRFLNTAGEITRPQQWNDSDRPKLWLYNLHYFDDLRAEGHAARAEWHRALVARWIAENPAGGGNGWEPYPVSLRIVNWIAWALGGGSPPPGFADSLAVQARWLTQRLEHHLLGNHLLANAKALVFAGLWFEGAEAERWLATGAEIYRRELPEQVLADGGHFERSPMYHAIILEDLLDLWNLAGAYGHRGQAPFAALPEPIARMRTWLKAMGHGDGRIGFFNDAAFGIAPEPAELEAYAARLGLGPAPATGDGVTDLAPSGYFRLQAGEAVLLADCAPVGPDYLPGHAHADTLSFELSLGPDRVIVNGGTSEYWAGPQRLIERSTASHSTVEIDALDSSEVWGGFRVGRRARVRDRRCGATDAAVFASAAHDGYAWRPGRPLHRRSWELDEHSMTVVDRIEGRADAAVAHFHLGEGVDAEVAADGLSGRLVLPSDRMLAWTTTAPARIERSEWRPEFGRHAPTRQLVIELGQDALVTTFRW